MQTWLDTMLFGIYPYVAFAVFALGSLIRFDREQYTWKTDSSQFLRRGQLRAGSNLFHLGILGIVGGHTVGLLTPMAVWHALGITAPMKQMVAIVAGGLFGAMLLAGLLLLIHRRLTEPRIRVTTRFADGLVLGLLLAQVLLGLATIPLSAAHRDGEAMVRLMMYIQHVATFQGDATTYLAGAAPVFKLHILLGLTLFLVFPFTRLVHALSGLATLRYVGRAYQIVRTRRRALAGAPR